MKPLALAFALASSLALTLPAIPAIAADRSPAAVQTASFAIDDAEQDMLATFGKSSLKPGQFLWQGTGEVDRVVIDLSRQMAYAYQGDSLVAVSTVSSGDEDHLSPIGIFNVMEKKPMHRSIKYDNAPMPFMQRITDTGVALHAGKLPGYPASHGCVRLPAAFASKLFAATKVGTQVLIAEPDGFPGGKRGPELAMNGAG